MTIKKQDIERYWVFDWLDRHRISTVEAVRLLLSNSVAFDELKRAAATAVSQFGKTVPQGESVLVGRGIDLSGQLDCFDPSWRKQQAQRLFNKVWHYFDKVVIEDSIAHELALHEGDKQIPNWLVAHLEVLIYLREIGAEPLLEFRLKPPPCQVHLAQHVKEASLSRVLKEKNQLVNSIAKETTFALEHRSDGSIDYRIDHKDFGHTQWGTLTKASAKGLSLGEIKIAALKRVFDEFLAYLASDVRAAQIYKTPLGAAIPFHQRMLANSYSPTVADVAMSMHLPVIEGLTPDVLLRIREDEQEYFTRFRIQLRLAIQERLKNAQSKDPLKIATEVQRDVMEPELNALKQRLRMAEKNVAKKSAVGIFLGALATTCGLLAGAVPPVALAAGLTAAVSVSGNAAGKYLDEISEAHLNWMYFAWQAEKHS